MKLELKEIPVANILANFSQPREKFDKEKIQELAESILSNGLVNPITVKEWKGNKFMIVTGERRWRAHKVAGLKTMQAIVKEYESDGQMMIESLIENVHREDLSEAEKYKYFKKIMQIEKIPNVNQLANRIKISKKNISYIFDVFEQRQKLSSTTQNAGSGIIAETKSLPENERKKLIEKAVKKDIGQRQIREEVKVIKQSTPEVKRALLNDDIDVKQAESISKLKTSEQRTKAIQEHKNIKMVDRGVEKHIKTQDDNKNKREFDKRLLQVTNWIASYRASITEKNSVVEKSVKLLLMNIKLLPYMDDRQKEKLQEQLDRDEAILEKNLRIVNQIQEKL